MGKNKEPKSFSDVVEILSKEINTVAGVVDVLSEQIGHLDKKIDNVQVSLESSIDILALQIHGINKRLDGIDARLDGIDKRLDGMDTRIDNLEDGLDRRFAQAHGDIMQVMGAENDKLLTVVDLLHDKDVVTPAERRTVRLMKPFPKR